MNSKSILNYLHFSPPTHERDMVLKGMQEFIKKIINLFSFVHFYNMDIAQHQNLIAFS